MRRSRRRAFTLVETIAVMVVVGVVSGVISTVLYAATDAYAATESRRRGIEEISFAIEKVSRLVREEPASSMDPGSSSIVEASAERLVFESGLRIEFLNGSLEVEIPGLGEAVLLSAVDSCVFDLYPDGPPDREPIDTGSGESPGPARLLQVRLEAAGQTLCTRVLLRSAYGAGS